MTRGAQRERERKDAEKRRAKNTPKVRRWCCAAPSELASPPSSPCFLPSASPSGQQGGPHRRAAQGAGRQHHARKASEKSGRSRRCRCCCCSRGGCAATRQEVNAWLFIWQMQCFGRLRCLHWPTPHRQRERASCASCAASCASGPGAVSGLAALPADPRDAARFTVRQRLTRPQHTQRTSATSRLPMAPSMVRCACESCLRST